MSPIELQSVIGKVGPRLTIENRRRVARYALALLSEHVDSSDRTDWARERAFEEEQLAPLPAIEREREKRCL